MRYFVRLIVMWLIAVALPMQGVAAATMLHCGAAQAGVAAQGHDHAAHSAHAKHGQATGDKASCSACASCCSAAALPAMPLVVAPQDDAPTASVPPPHPVVVFLTDGPERPPRNTLA